MRKIDVHAHLGVWPTCVPACDPVGRLLRLCERESIAYAACSSLLALCYDMEEGNAELAEAVAAHEQLLGYVAVNPNWLARSVAEMERYLPLEGFVGVKIHPRLSGVPENAPEMADLIGEVARRASVLLMHTVDQNAARQMGRYAQQHPRLAIILAHAGHSDSDVAARVARECPNVYLDFCCEWPGAGKIERALEVCGAEKVLFGTDMDVLEPSFTRGMFEGAGLTDEQRRQVGYDNAARLFGLPMLET
jgi:predicted TIM-barrel fold metal-dependent hydrolase